MRPFALLLAAALALPAVAMVDDDAVARAAAAPAGEHDGAACGCEDRGPHGGCEVDAAMHLAALPVDGVDTRSEAAGEAGVSDGVGPPLLAAAARCSAAPRAPATTLTMNLGVRGKGGMPALLSSATLLLLLLLFSRWGGA